MRNHIFRLTLLAFVLLFGACSSKPAPAASDPITGTWSGDYGQDSERRDPVKLELVWKDGKLDGTVHAGPRDLSLPLRSGSFTPESGAITMEFDAQANGQPVHYRAEGKVDGTKMSGSWGHDAQHGDFKVTRQ
jgi:hypothetical protein